MVDSKSRDKSRPKPDRPGRNGGMLVTGGRDGGRPLDEFKRRMREIASSDEALKYLDECTKGEHGPKAAASAREYATERGYGKVAQVHEHQGSILHKLAAMQPDELRRIESMSDEEIRALITDGSGH